MPYVAHLLLFLVCSPIMENSRGCGPRSQWQNLMFDGDERKYELWETKILGYLRLKGLKETVLNPTDNAASAEKNKNAYAELIQFLDDRSLGLVMSEARDNGYEALKILREHYPGRSKPRIITLYHQFDYIKEERVRRCDGFCYQS